MSYDILVSFERSTRCGRSCNEELPEVKDGPDSYRNAVQAFRMAHPYVDGYTSWNEPNLKGSDRFEDPPGSGRYTALPYQPTWDEPYRAGLYFQELRRQCARAGTCRVAAGDFLDHDAASVFRRKEWPRCARVTGRSRCSYLEAYRGGMGNKSQRWAWHAYSDGKKRESLRFDAFRAAINRPGEHPDIWLSEQGAVLTRRGRTRAGGIPAINADLRYLLDGLIPAGGGQIKRFYYYQWKGDVGHDSGLINYANNKRRKLYSIYAAHTR